MAGLGWKLWSTGDTVSAADFQGYIADEVISVHASTSARDTQISSPTEGMFAFTKDTDTLYYRSSSAWVAVDLAGDISSIVTAAASGLSGGATSGAVTLTLNLAGLTAAQAFGADGAGVDVVLHSTTSGDNATYDASAARWILEGTNSTTALDVTDGNVVIGDGTLSVSGAITATGGVTGNVTGTAATVTGAAQSAITSVGTLTSLTVSGTTTTYLNVITDSTTTRTPGLTDASAYILCTHGTGITVTLPQDSAVAFPTGSNIIFERNGAGTLTFAAGTGATVNSKDATLTCADRYTTIAAVKIAADTWTIFGNIG
jgi:hypothetical protein